MVALGLNPVVDKAMASWLGQGSISVLYYAHRLYVIPLVFVSSIVGNSVKQSIKTLANICPAINGIFKLSAIRCGTSLRFTAYANLGKVVKMNKGANNTKINTCFGFNVTPITIWLCTFKILQFL